MSKKKANRKKQLRQEQREQKVQKVVSLFPEEEEAVAASPDLPVPHMPLLLVPEMIAMRQGGTGGQISPFSKLGQEKVLSPHNQALVDALDSDHTKELVADLLEEEPDFLLAHYVWVMESLEIVKIEDLQLIEDLYRHAVRKWKKSGFGDFTQLNAQESLEVMTFVLDYYLSHGFLSKALTVVQFVMDKRVDFFPPGFIPKALATYNQLFRYDLLERYYRNCAKKGAPSDTVLIHLAIGQFCAGNFEDAEATMKRLQKINAYTGSVMGDWDWLEDASELEELGFYFHGSREALLVALEFMGPFIIERPLLFEFLLGYGTVDMSGFDWDVFGIFSLSAIPEMKGIRWDKTRTFFHDAGIRSAEDFMKWTEKDLLTLKGIGPVTIKKLKENGVVFKK